MNARRVLVLSSATGGGHDMRAAALSAWVTKLHGNTVEVKQWQALEESSALDRFGVALYNTIQRRAPWTHHLYFNFLETARLHRREWTLRGRKRLWKMAKTFRPHVIVSTHPHLNHGYFAALRRALGGAVRCLTYCGELYGGYGFSRHWVNSQADGFIAAVPPCAEAALKLGMPPERIHLGGFLLRPPFFEGGLETSSTDLPQIRKTLFGESTEGPVVLLGTGGNGANDHLHVVRSLKTIRTPLTVVALCGRNERVFDGLRKVKSAPHRIIPLRYREDMADLLRATDLAFIRPGSGMTSECIVTRCPVVFNGIGGVMPQENINIRYLRSLELDIRVVKRPDQFAEAIGSLLHAGWKTSLASQRATFSRINPNLHPEGIVAEVLR